MSIIKASEIEWTLKQRYLFSRKLHGSHMCRMDDNAALFSRKLHGSHMCRMDDNAALFSRKLHGSHMCRIWKRKITRTEHTKCNIFIT